MLKKSKNIIALKFKRTILSVFLFILASGIIFPQPNNISSILQQIETIKQKGTEFKVIKPDSALFLYDQALTIISESENSIKTDNQILQKKSELLSAAGLILQKKTGSTLHQNILTGR